MTKNDSPLYPMHPYSTAQGARLDELLSDYRPNCYGESFEDWTSFLSADYSVLWRKIVEDETVEPGSVARRSLGELADLAQVYGRHLVPIPYLEDLYSRRWAGKVDSPGVLVALPRSDGKALVRSRTRGGVNIVTKAWDDVVTLEITADHFPLGEFAPTLPMGLVNTATKLPPAATNEIMTLVLAEALGAAEGAFAKTLSWVMQRTVFGHVLGSYQAIKHLLADVFMALELLRSAVDSGLHGSLSTTSARRAFEYGLDALEGCVQAHGGRGFAWDGGIAPRMRHLLALRMLAAGLSPGEAE
jgi:hypothetical protein